jgi:peptide subunit release factor 1 (eRF1)
MNEILKYKSVRGKPNTLTTIIIRNHTKEEFINYLNSCLNKIQNIKDNFKRQYINDRIFNFKQYLIDNCKNEINNIFLVDNDVYNYQLTKVNIQMLNEYNIRDLYFKYDDHFHIDYIHDLFNDLDFYKVLELNKKKISIWNINTTKNKLIENLQMNTQSDFDDYLKKNKNIDLIFGTSTFIKKNKSGNVINKNLGNNEILDEIEKIIIKKNHNKLSDICSLLQNKNTSNKFIVGRKESRKYTQMGMLKSLFIHENFYDVFSNRQKEFLNYEIIIIKKLEKNDMSYTFLNDYNGFIGELYYAIDL